MSMSALGSSCSNSKADVLLGSIERLFMFMAGHSTSTTVGFMTRKNPEET